MALLTDDCWLTAMDRCSLQCLRRSIRCSEDNLTNSLTKVHKAQWGKTMNKINILLLTYSSNKNNRWSYSAQNSESSSLRWTSKNNLLKFLLLLELSQLKHPTHQIQQQVKSILTNHHSTTVWVSQSSTMLRKVENPQMNPILPSLNKNSSNKGSRERTKSSTKEWITWKCWTL